VLNDAEDDLKSWEKNNMTNDVASVSMVSVGGGDGTTEATNSTVGRTPQNHHHQGEDSTAVSGAVEEKPADKTADNGNGHEESTSASSSRSPTKA
jgi:hypothetical protein